MIKIFYNIGRWYSTKVVSRRWLTRIQIIEMIESVSRRALSGSSGSYHVRGAELARNRRLKSLSATVIFLDDSQHTFQLDVSSLFFYYFYNLKIYKTLNY